MSIKGNTVHREIKGKIKEIESQSSSLASQMYEIENDLTRLSSERENCYSLLASHYLPELDADSVKSTLRELREDVGRVFSEKRERRKVLEKLMEENRKRNSELETSIDDITEKINQKGAQRDEVVKSIFEHLQKDSSYIVLDTEAKKAEARLQQNRQRVAEVEEESNIKLPEFETNKLFRYLLQTGYGTDNYQPNRLKRRLDSWVARKVNFADNKKCYDFLKSMPEMMKAEVDRRQVELDAVVDKMKDIESVVEKHYGLPEIVDSANKLLTQRKKLLSLDVEQDKQYSDYTDEREIMDGVKDPYHVRAVQSIKEYLKGETIAELKSKARETPGTEDDKIVIRVDTIDKRVRELKDEAKKIREERDLIETKLESIRGVEKRFRQKDYEGSYSTFSGGFDINDLLTGYLLGRFSVSDVNSKIDRSQHTETPSYSYTYSGSYGSSYGGSRGHSSSSSSSSSSGSGFGGFSGFSSGGGFGGGGFSSGSGV